MNELGQMLEKLGNIQSDLKETTAAIATPQTSAVSEKTFS